MTGRGVGIEWIGVGRNFLNRRVPVNDYYHAMKVLWNELPRKAWNEFHATHGGSMQQSWAYGQALQAMGISVHRAAIKDGNTLVALAQFIGRRLAFYIGLASCTRGPVWKGGLAPEQQAQIYQLLRQSIPTHAWRATLFSPNEAQTSLAPQQVRGLRRVMTGYSTVMIDLRQELDTLRQGLEGKWRNRLVKAQAHEGVTVQIGAHRKQCQALLLREGEQRKTKNFYGLPTAFVDAYIEAHERADKAFVLCSAQLAGEPLASMLFLLHGRSASYYIGWSSPEGRKLNMHNLLMWRAIEHLKGQQVTDLDLGGINTHDLPGISRFKLGTGGQVLTLAGTYF